MHSAASLLCRFSQQRWIQHRSTRLRISLLACCIALACARFVYVQPANAGFNLWTPIGPYGGTITALVADPTHADTLYVGVPEDGVYKSSDGGTTWQAINSGLPEQSSVSTLAVDDSRGTIYAGTVQHGVYKSSDNGAHWTAANTGIANFDTMTITTLAIAPLAPQTLYIGTSTFYGHGGTQGNLFKSTNGGASWTSIIHGFGSATTPIISALMVNTVDSKIVYAGTDSGVYKSVDSGGTWKPNSIGIPEETSLDVTFLQLDTSHPKTLYVGIASGGVYKSTDSAAHWSAANNGLPDVSSILMLALAIHPTDVQTLYISLKGEGIFKSTDGGGHWSPIGGTLPTNAGVTALLLDKSNPATIYIGTEGDGVFKSVNGGNSWTMASTGLTHLEVAELRSDPTSPATLYAAVREAGGFDSGGVYKSVDSGKTWVVSSGGLPRVSAEGLVLDPKHPATLYVHCWNKLEREQQRPSLGR